MSGDDSDIEDVPPPPTQELANANGYTMAASMQPPETTLIEPPPGSGMTIVTDRKEIETISTPIHVSTQSPKDPMDSSEDEGASPLGKSKSNSTAAPPTAIPSMLDDDDDAPPAPSTAPPPLETTPAPAAVAPVAAAAATKPATTTKDEKKPAAAAAAAAATTTPTSTTSKPTEKNGTTDKKPATETKKTAFNPTPFGAKATTVVAPVTVVTTPKDATPTTTTTPATTPAATKPAAATVAVAAVATPAKDSPKVTPANGKDLKVSTTTPGASPASSPLNGAAGAKKDNTIVTTAVTTNGTASKPAGVTKQNSLESKDVLAPAPAAAAAVTAAPVSSSKVSVNVAAAVLKSRQQLIDDKRALFIAKKKQDPAWATTDDDDIPITNKELKQMEAEADKEILAQQQALAATPVAAAVSSTPAEAKPTGVTKQSSVEKTTTTPVTKDVSPTAATKSTTTTTTTTTSSSNTSTPSTSTTTTPSNASGKPIPGKLNTKMMAIPIFVPGSAGEPAKQISSGEKPAVEAFDMSEFENGTGGAAGEETTKSTDVKPVDTKRADSTTSKPKPPLPAGSPTKSTTTTTNAGAASPTPPPVPANVAIVPPTTPSTPSVVSPMPPRPAAGRAARIETEHTSALAGTPVKSVGPPPVPAGHGKTGSTVTQANSPSVNSRTSMSGDPAATPVGSTEPVSPRSVGKLQAGAFNNLNAVLARKDDDPSSASSTPAKKQPPLPPGGPPASAQKHHKGGSMPAPGSPAVSSSSVPATPQRGVNNHHHAASATSSPSSVLSEGGASPAITHASRARMPRKTRTKVHQIQKAEVISTFQEVAPVEPVVAVAKITVKDVGGKKKSTKKKTEEKPDAAKLAQQEQEAKYQALIQAASSPSASSAPEPAVDPSKLDESAKAALAAASMYGEFVDQGYDESKVEEYKTLTQNIGGLLLKHGKSGKPHERSVWITPALMLYFTEPQKKGLTPPQYKIDNKSCINLALATMPKINVVKGKTTANFARATKVDESLCFSIIGARERSELDLQAKSVEERDAWYAAIKYTLQLAQERREAALLQSAMGSY